MESRLNAKKLERRSPSRKVICHGVEAKLELPNVKDTSMKLHPGDERWTVSGDGSKLVISFWLE